MNTWNRQHATGPTAVPVLTMPLGGEMDDDDRHMCFTIDTAAGEISVKGNADIYGGGSWACRGTAAALAAHGLIDPAWLPGAPGNNKVRQGVMFGNGAPSLLRGQWSGKKLDNDYITILRVSGTTYEVKLPATPQQSQALAAAVKRREDRREAAKRQAEAKQQEEQRLAQMKQLTPDALRARLLGYADAIEGYWGDMMSDSRFQFDAAAQAEIRDCFARLRRVVSDGRMTLAAREFEGGNVVALRR